MSRRYLHFKFKNVIKPGSTTPLEPTEANDILILTIKRKEFFDAMAGILDSASILGKGSEIISLTFLGEITGEGVTDGVDPNLPPF